MKILDFELRKTFAPVILSITLPFFSGISFGAIPLEISRSLAPMLENVTPAVVNISSEGLKVMRENPIFSDPFFRDFFDIPMRPRTRKTQSLGSGVIIDADRGLVLTNSHVIANADIIKVTLRDGREFKGELVGSDPETDVAVVKIEPKNLQDIKFSDSSKLRVGDFVVAIGNPFGLGQTVTSGIVSALGRSGLGISGYEDLIQTDASINPGNSGGALVNLDGDLVGLNTAIYSRHGGNIGIGFAISINMARHVMEQLVQYGTVQRGGIGAQFQDLTPSLAEAFGLGDIPSGVIIARIAELSPADVAGLQVGDIVTSINNRIVKTVSEVDTQVALSPVGEKVPISLLRQGRKIDTEFFIEIEVQSSQLSLFKSSRFADSTIGEIPNSSPFYGRIAGVRIEEIKSSSPAWISGLRKGDIIQAINGRKVRSVDEFVQTVTKFAGRLRVTVRRGRQVALVIIE
jgi:serine protease Do/serine protease DegQ